ncbi:hypothetical protein AAG747_08005 [Rapidithrix thailandica]|uniref:Uncharacterized protein n=2 Tax=Rapidithrix thailandica TaxID=413964 RepID=A0AAW9S930_9BACT
MKNPPFLYLPYPIRNRMNVFLITGGILLAGLVAGDALKTKYTAGKIDIGFAGIDWPRISKGKVYFEPAFRFSNYSTHSLQLSHLVISLYVKDGQGVWKLIVKSPPAGSTYRILPRDSSVERFPLQASLLSLGLNFFAFLSSMEIKVDVQGEANGYPFSESFTKQLGKTQTVNGI